MGPNFKQLTPGEVGHGVRQGSLQSMKQNAINQFHKKEKNQVVSWKIQHLIKILKDNRTKAEVYQIERIPQAKGQKWENTRHTEEMGATI